MGLPTGHRGPAIRGRQRGTRQRAVIAAIVPDAPEAVKRDPPSARGRMVDCEASSRAAP